MSSSTPPPAGRLPPTPPGTMPFTGQLTVAHPGLPSYPEVKMKRILFLAGLLLSFALASCSLLPAQTSTPIPVPPLTLEAVQNATYRLPVYDRTVTLTDGVYSYES